MKRVGCLHGSGKIWVALDPIFSFFVVFYSQDQVVGNYGPIHSLSVLAIFSHWPGRLISQGAEILKDTKSAMPSLQRSLGYRGFFTLLLGRGMHWAG